jgi:nitrate reductase gamma subunit
MESWIEFGRGPLFRIAFALMLLRLLRAVTLTLIGIVEAYRRSPDKIVNWREVRGQTLAWLFPFTRLWRARPVYSTLSFLFHAGLLLVPLFLAAHVLLWKRSTGFAWYAIPHSLANSLTGLAIVAGIGLCFGRLLDSSARKMSRPQDFAWLLLLVVPFLSGFLCTNIAIGAKAYQSLMVLHIYSADLIMLLIPFTRLSHCILAPLSQTVTAIAWKFPAGAGDRVAATLGYADRPSWIPKARLEKPPSREICVEVVAK